MENFLFGLFDFILDCLISLLYPVVVKPDALRVPNPSCSLNGHGVNSINIC